MKSVYLAGPINGCSDDEMRAWRYYAKQQLLCETLDPTDRDYRGRESESGVPEAIVVGDTINLKACSIVLANCQRASWGTAMEIAIAKREFQKVVVLIVPENQPVSPWLRLHSDAIFNTVKLATDWINGVKLTTLAQ